MLIALMSLRNHVPSNYLEEDFFVVRAEGIKMFSESMLARIKYGGCLTSRKKLDNVRTGIQSLVIR
jgi:hypothetical protein